MQKLIVKNFGPIEYAEIEIKDLMIFIGPQASGKSTLAKLVYFYNEAINLISMPQKLDDTFADYIKHKNILTLEQVYSQNLTKLLKQIFNLENDNDEQFWINEKTSLSFIYSNYDIFPDININITFSNKNIFQIEIDEHFTSIFSEIIKSDFIHPFTNPVIYIPAGRILFSTFAEDLLSIKFQHLNNLEYFIKEYVNEANTQKQNARLTHKESISSAKTKNKTAEKQIYFAEIAQDIIEHKILKGKYQYKEAKEKLFFADEKFIPFRYASSGQQEANWIASCLFSMILKSENRFLVIEEPEAHLYPTGQKAIVELMGLALNATKSPILLTTHSPYILTSFDNLIQAKEVSKLEKVDAETLAKEIDIPQACWIDFERVGVFYMADGKVEDIMDYERKAIGANKIDEVSEELGRVFDTLLHYKYKDV